MWKLEEPRTTTLGQDPNREHRINANSFQQNAIITVGAWQYATFYTSKEQQNGDGALYVNLARRRVGETAQNAEGWEVLTFKDYEQVTDDGHNTISIGVCKGDGTIHVAFDHHCDRLRYRVSQLELAFYSPTSKWDPSSFTTVQNFLPGIPSSDLFNEVTYPRFVNVDNNLLLTYRIGKAGLGSDVLYKYSSHTHTYSFLGAHLTGIASSPYINGLDYRLGRLHTSWTYRRFYEYNGSLDPTSSAHKFQAGPNGPENNYQLNYAYSDDEGLSWLSSKGVKIATVDGGKGEKQTILPSTEGITVFNIPMNSGILNQEGQCADWGGGFHVLNRENRSGRQKWIHYYRDPSGHWTSTALSQPPVPTTTGTRGSICVDRGNNLYIVLNGNVDSSMTILRARKEYGFGHTEFEIVWRREDGFDGEPLIDIRRLDIEDTLSIFTRTNGTVEKGREVVVLDFDLSHS